MSEKKQSKEGCLVVLISILVFAVVLGLALFMANRDAEAPIASTQRFRARPGTTREGAVALTSRKRADTPELEEESPPPEEVQAPSPTRRPSTPISVRSLSRPDEEEELSDAEREIQAALNAFSPRDGIERLHATLRATTRPKEKAAIHQALARLYMQLEPPDITAAEQALDMAVSNAEDQATRDAITLEQAQLYLQRGEIAIARTRLQTALQTPGAASDSPSRMRLELAHAQLLELMDEPEQAAAAYAEVAEKATAAKDSGATHNAEADEIARLAVMRLTTLYRSQGRNEEADRLRDTFLRETNRTP